MDKELKRLLDKALSKEECLDILIVGIYDIKNFYRKPLDQLVIEKLDRKLEHDLKQIDDFSAELTANNEFFERYNEIKQMDKDYDDLFNVQEKLFKIFAELHNNNSTRKNESD